MLMFERALDQHPEALLFGFVVAISFVLFAAAWLMDILVGRAEREDPPAVRHQLPPLETSAELMAAHRQVVLRHARETRVTVR